MARFGGPNWKESHRLGIPLSDADKGLEKRPYVPGQHGPSQRKKLSEYGLQLRGKQKPYYLYGMTERQFHNTFDTAGKKFGVHDENFMILLTNRLGAVIYPLGLARTRRQTRQLINHGHVLVGSKRVDTPSYSAKPGQAIPVREESQELDIIVELVKTNSSAPEHLNFDADSLTGTFIRLLERNELPAEINKQLVTEYYSR